MENLSYKTSFSILCKVKRVYFWKSAVHFKNFLLVLLFFLVFYPTQSGARSEQHVHVSVLQENSALVPNTTYWIMLRFQIEEGWHIYWENPGDAGLPPEILWQKPTNLVAGTLHFPLPERIPFEELMVFGYKGLVRFLVPFEVSDSVDTDTIDVQAQVNWLVCKDICIPEHTNLSFTIPVSTYSQPLRPTIHEFVQARNVLPQTLPNQTSFERGRHTLTLTLDPTEFPLGQASQLTFFPYARNIIQNNAPQHTRHIQEHVLLDLTLSTTTPSTQTLDDFRGVLVVETPSILGVQRQGFVLNPTKTFLPLSTSTSSSTQIRTPSLTNPAQQISRDGEEESESTERVFFLGGEGESSSLSLITAVLLGLLGGIVLNVMPCVFPVLFLKLYPLIQQQNKEIGYYRKEGLAFTGGILTMFVLLGILLVLLKEGGALLGWGFHLQYPLVVFGLMILFFVIGLVFSDFLTIGETWSRLGGYLPFYRGYVGSFFNGLLLVVVASPCTVPFMGTAIGFAVIQSWERSLLIFVSLGLGMALPYLFLCWNVQWVRWLPRSGSWMVSVKHAFAFPMYGTSLWLLWVWVHQVGIQGLWWGLVSLWVMGLSAWVWRITRSTSMRRLGLLTMLVSWIVVIGVSGGITPQQKDETFPLEQAYTDKTLQHLLQEQRTVFVYFTAAWCVTCLVNERVVLRSEQVQQVFAQQQIITLKADWTLYNPEITQVLERFERSGIPFYVIYRFGQEPFVLPDLLSQEVLITALTKGETS